MTDKLHSCNLHCERLECIKAQRDDLRQRYFDLCDLQARSLNQAIQNGKWEADFAVLAFRSRLVNAIEDMPFGDTSDSLAAFVRDFK